VCVPQYVYSPSPFFFPSPVLFSVPSSAQDVENLGQGAFDVALKQQLAASRNVVVVLSEASLDRCVTDHDNKDFVRKEISMALKMGKNIVPVSTDDFAFPEAEALPEDIRPIVSINAVPWSHMYQEASMRKLLSFMQR
jgi:hypothetical protein